MSETNERHPDIFNPEQAAAYLNLTSPKALERLREKGVLVGFEGWAPFMLYWREDLNRCAMRMFGRDPDAGKPKEIHLKMGGQR